MKTLPHSVSYQVLLLQAADEGRGDVLFGDSVGRARDVVLPFLIGERFPDIYFEHPLIGDPFLDVTVLFGQIDSGTRIDSATAGDHGAMFDWYAEAHAANEDISCGFELDTKEAEVPTAAVHFQPRKQTDLVRPFCEAIGEPERANLYLDLAERMPKGWPLSFFGLFRGRPDSPLRVCGYLSSSEKDACAADPDHLAKAFDTVGFSSYDDEMLAQVSTLLAASPDLVDFQFDVFPDGHIGPTFAIDVQFGIERPEAVQKTFSDGAGARVMGLLEKWHVADDRWRIAVQSAFARSLPCENDAGETQRFAFTLMPQWLKARWTDGSPQPSKLYHLAHAGVLDTQESQKSNATTGVGEGGAAGK